MKKCIVSFAIMFILLTFSTTAEAASFKDVPKSHWGYEAIHSMSERGIISGFADGTFRSTEPVTRAQAAKIVALSLGIKPSSNYKLSFTDVPSSHWSYAYIAPLVEKGIFSDGKQFYPNKALTRGEMAAVLTKGYALQPVNQANKTFKDIPKNSALYLSVVAISDADITKIANGEAFRPNDHVTRAQMAAFVYRADNHAKKQQPTPHNPKPEMPKTPEVETIALINEYRKQHRLQPLQHDTELSRVALAKARDMAEKKYFDHYSPTYGSVREMLDYFTYDWMSFGENIAMDYQGVAAEVSKAWYDSPDHRQNILNDKFTQIGAAMYVDAAGTPYWVHLFASK